MSPRKQMLLRIPSTDKARLNRFCNRNRLTLNDVVYNQLRPLLDQIEREEREAASAEGRQAG